MQLIFFLSANIALTTFFQSAWPAIMLNGVTLFIIMLLSCIPGRGRSHLKRGGVILGAFFLSMTSLFWAHKNVISEGTSRYLGTGEIIEKQTGRYLFLTPFNERLLYYSDNEYEVGTMLFVAGSLQEATGEKNLLKMVSWKSIWEKSQTLGDEEWGFDKNKRLFMRGWQGSLYEKQGSVIGKKPIPWMQRQREQLVELLEKPYDKHTLGLTLGMLIGDRSYLTKEEYQSFISSGLVHIVAVSGGNIVLIVAFLSAILFFIPYYFRLALISGAIVIYATVCGFDSSVVRAVIMALIGMMALFVGRGVSIRRSVGYVYVGMLVWNPYYLLYDLGFIFSFSAIVGLVYFSSRWKVKTTKKVRQGSLGRSLIGVAKSFRNVYVLPSISASLGVSGSLLFFTSHVNLLSIVSNILVVPLVPFVMIYGFFAAIFYSLTHWQFVTLPQERAVSRIHAVNTRGVDHAVMLSAIAGSARLLVGTAIIACVMIVKFTRKRIV